MTPYLPMLQYNQFIIWKSVPDTPKPRKVPCDLAGNASDAHNPANHTDFTTAQYLSEQLGSDYGVGFVFTTGDPFFVVDIDNCLQSDGIWSQVALTLISALPGCLVEVSVSGKGLHIIGSGKCPPHGKKNVPLGLEFYTELRFLALGNMETATGNAGTDATLALPWLVASYFPPSEADVLGAEWTDGPVEEWNGYTSDAELLEAMLKSRSAAAAFGGGVTVSDLWYAVEDRLATMYPSQSDSAYDRSSADAALAQHLAFWTGKDCERMERLMRASDLNREKYDRDDYLPRTILRACGLQKDVFGQRTTLNPDIEVVPLKGTEKQVAYAEGIRAQVLNTVSDPEVRDILAHQPNASLWLNNPTATADQLVRMVTPSPYMDRSNDAPIIKTGFQFMAADQQVEFFKGCTYIIPIHKVFSVYHNLYFRPDQFNATYGGFVFQMDDSSDKTTRKAWEAFTESQVVAYPKADGTWFRPDLPSGKLIEHEGFTYVNTYVPLQTQRMKGDITPFWNHLCRLLPDDRDRRILLSYMAACVQHKGSKFQWCPLIQGAEGNGKTLLSSCVSFSVGGRYTSTPPASDIADKFNSWIFGKLFIAVEDIFVADHRSEVIEALKPMITNKRLSKRAMQQDRIDDDNFANFMLNSNHKDAIKIDDSARRFCVFYTAQQCKADLVRDGMDGYYFPELYRWLDTGGYAVVNEFLHTYAIEEEFNPAGLCQRAPRTSSTDEVLGQSMGTIELMVKEAIDEGAIGLMNGWVSSVALERILKASYMERFLPVSKRRAFMERLGYVRHPHLHDGRTNAPLVIDDNKKPILYVLKDSELKNLTEQKEIVNRYSQDQISNRF